MKKVGIIMGSDSDLPVVRKAIDTLYGQILCQPRTPEGSFWHKAIYPNQVWLDGLYMAQVFYTRYTT